MRLDDEEIQQRTQAAREALTNPAESPALTDAADDRDDLPTYELDLGAMGTWIMIPQGVEPQQIVVRNKEGSHLVINNIPHEFRCTLYNWPDSGFTDKAPDPTWRFNNPPPASPADPRLLDFDRAAQSQYSGYNSFILNRTDKKEWSYNNHTTNAYSKAYKLIPEYAERWVKSHPNTHLIARAWRLRQAWKNADNQRYATYAQLEKDEQAVREAQEAYFAFRDQHPGIEG